MKRRRKSGFTLLEMLMVVVVISILIGILLSAIFQTKKTAKRRLAQVQCAAIATGIREYHYNVRKWPCPDNGQPDTTYEENNYEVIAILTNSTRTYIDIANFMVNEDGAVVNPWGRPYTIYLDTDYDGAMRVNGELNLDGVVVQ